MLGVRWSIKFFTGDVKVLFLLTCDIGKPEGNLFAVQVHIPFKRDGRSCRSTISQAMPPTHSLHGIIKIGTSGTARAILQHIRIEGDRLDKIRLSGIIRTDQKIDPLQFQVLNKNIAVILT